ncbi:hypothetical protein [Enterococcus faecalis]|uniref:hypothetical protein n=1 Tax=Enterococcus faecalis TaxID=1351 RepID=UPI001F583B1D|nr:hypothetical protein [Enterococcus faecalis]
MDEKLKSIVESSIKTVLSKEQYSEKAVIEKISSKKDLASLIPTMTIFTMEYTNDVICQLISNLSDSGYLQMPDEDV